MHPLIKHKLGNVHGTQTYMLSKLTEVHQSNAYDWIIKSNHNNLKNIKRFYISYLYASKVDIIDQFNTRHIVSGYHHPQYPKHLIVSYYQADKMLGLVALHANIGIDEQHESGMFFVGIVKMCHWQHLVLSNIFMRM